MDLKRDATPDVTLNQLWRHTPAQGQFSMNMLALRGGRPELLGLRDILTAFIGFREEVITRRSKFELNKARERAHLLLGLVIAVTNLDEVVRTIRASVDARRRRARHCWRACGRWPTIREYLELVEAVDGESFGDTYKLSDAQVKRDPRPAAVEVDRARPRRDWRRAEASWPRASPNCWRS